MSLTSIPFVQLHQAVMADQIHAELCQSHQTQQSRPEHERKWACLVAVPKTALSDSETETFVATCDLVLQSSLAAEVLRGQLTLQSSLQT